jgi:hypothetical protein
VDSNSVTVRLGNGNGTFRPGLEFDAGSSPQAIALGDLNGDGRLDLAAARWGYGEQAALSILLGREDGTFEPKREFGSARSNNAPPALAIGDVDEDGWPDAALTTGIDPYLVDAPADVFLGNGDGTFGSRISIEVGAGPAACTSGDWNGDGSEDLAVVNRTAGTVSVLLGHGDGSFPLRHDWPAGREPRSLAAADLNGDQRLDLVVSDGSADSIHILFGEASGRFGPASGIPVSGRSSDVAVADFDRDGARDLAVGLYDRVSVLRGQGDGSFQPARDLAVPDAGVVVAADVNGDGWPDLAVGGQSRLRLFLGGPDGSFTELCVVGLCSQADWITSGDLDSNGCADLVVGTFWTGCVSVLLGASSGPLQPRDPAFVSSGALLGGSVGDLDGDGVPDLVVSENASRSLVFLRGLGNGSFEYAGGFGFASGPWQVHIADLNGDGSLDLATMSPTANSVSVLLNQNRRTPVELQDLEVDASESAIMLRWSLSPTARDDLVGVRVQRADDASGPYADRTHAPLEPAPRMSFKDRDVGRDHTYWFRLVLQRAHGKTMLTRPVSVTTPGSPRDRTALAAPVEGAADGSVTIHYTIGQATGPVTLAVYDVRGRCLRRLIRGPRSAGEHVMVWDRRTEWGTRLGRGVCFLRLQLGDTSVSRKLVLVRP